MPQHSVLHSHGEVEWADRESDRKVVRDTLQCCHCQYTWIVVKGSGRQRGFCTQCMKPTCGKQQCIPCVPFLKKIEMIERGLVTRSIWANGVDSLPVSINVPSLPPSMTEKRSAGGIIIER